jgi:peptidoglycan/LPS O-acetylase OafA/YrhL
MIDGNPQQHDQRILALDGFRGLAVLMVTLYRFCEVSLTATVVGNLPSKAVLIGASGVDLFFVLSGFLITGILLESKGRQDYFSRFYLRRTLRIFPLYFASLVLFLLLLPSFGFDAVVQGDKIVDFTGPIAGNPMHLWLYTSNLSIAWADDWHFGALNHYWSLAIEEQFYLVWPMIVLLLAPRQLLTWCLIGFATLAACRIGFSVGGFNEIASKTFTLFRMDGLLLGAAAALLFRQLGSKLWNYQPWLRAGVLTSGILFCATFVFGKDDFTIRYSFVSIAATCLLLSTLACASDGLERRAFENPVLRSLGKFSYAMYIFQLPLIPLLAPWISPAQCAIWAGKPLFGALLYVAIMFSITYLIAVGSWYCFEVQFLNLRKYVNFSKQPQAARAEAPQILNQS